MKRIAMVIGMLGCDETRATESKLEDSKAKIAGIAVQQLANDAFPRWLMTNSSKACPDNVGELAKVVGAATADPWGTPYKMQCGTVPPGTPPGGIAISSAGPDKTHDTADDVVSWKR